MPEEITFRDLIEHLKSFIRLFFKKWYIIVAMGFIGGITGAFYAHIIKPKYQAELTFIVEDDSKGNAGGLLGIASQFGLNIDQTNDAFSPRNIIGILKSNKIIISTLLAVSEFNGQKNRLLNFYLENSGMHKAFQENKKLKDLTYPINQPFESFSRLQDSILKVVADQILKKVIEIEKTDEKTDIFKITCISKDESFSLFFSKQILTEVSDFYTETKTKRSLQVVNLLQRRADSIKAEYNIALTGRAASADQNVNPAFQSSVVNVQRKQTDVTILATGYGEIIKNLELAKFNLLKETPLFQVIDEPVLPLKKIKPGSILYGLLGAFLLCLFTMVYFAVKKDIQKKDLRDNIENKKA